MKGSHDEIEIKGARVVVVLVLVMLLQGLKEAKLLLKQYCCPFLPFEDLVELRKHVLPKRMQGEK
jgi:hypothetical protein